MSWSWCVLPDEALAVALDDASANWLKFTWIRPLAVTAPATCCPKAATAGMMGTASAAQSAAAFRMTADGSPLALAQTAAQADRRVLAHRCACASRDR
jgi:hypothetical protein